MKLESLVSQTTPCGQALRGLAKILVSSYNNGKPPKGFQHVTDIRTELLVLYMLASDL